MPAPARRIELVLRIDGEALRVSAPQPPARARLDELLPTMQAIDHAVRKAEATGARDYFALGLVCPFLEDDACSIHPRRPFVCRQYLVTSDPALCADPFENPVEVVPMPLQAATAMLSAASKTMGTPQHTVPLVLALEHARLHRDALRQRVDAEPVFRHWLQALSSG